MAITLIKRAYVIAYLQNNESNSGSQSSSVICCPLFRVNPDTFDSQKALAIVENFKSTLDSSFQVQAVKKVEGYKFIVN